MAHGKKSLRWIVVMIIIAIAVFAWRVLAGPNSWERMNVISPVGLTPDETFQEMRAAALSRNWPKMYGCMTVEARRDQISTLVDDIAISAIRIQNDKDYAIAAARKNQDPQMERKIQRAQEYLRVANKYNLTDKNYLSYGQEGDLDARRRYYSRSAAYVEDADEFVADAWDLLYKEGTSVFESEAHLSDLEIFDNYAIAKVHNFYSPYGNPEYCYVHFKNVDGRWLVDMSPWWIPWGPPLREVR